MATAREGSLLDQLERPLLARKAQGRDGVVVSTSLERGRDGLLQEVAPCGILFQPVGHPRRTGFTTCRDS